MTDKSEETGLNPETIFNEGYSFGQVEADELLREQIADELVTQGELSVDEAEELLFDPAPRRRGKRRGKIHCSPRQRATMPQICIGGGKSRRQSYDPAPRRYRKRRGYRRTYDPAPVGGYRAAAKRYYRKKGGAKGLIAGLRPLVGPAVLIGTVYQKYSERAVKLKAENKMLDGKLVDGWFMALMYDIKNRPTTSVMDRIKDNAGKIATPVILGVGVKYGAKKVRLHPKVNQVAGIGGEALIYHGIGNLINAILDPPDHMTQVQQSKPQIQIQSEQSIPMTAPVSSTSWRV